MRNVKTLLISGVILILAVGPVAAGWNPGDGHKMHDPPPEPDPNGFDVAFHSWDVDDQGDPYALRLRLADDWQCSQTGPVSDIHFWVSWEGGSEDPDGPGTIAVDIYSDQPEAGDDHSRPKDHLWGRAFSDDDYDYRFYDSGLQGWYDPYQDDALWPDHEDYYQINIENIAAPWDQEEGTIYWLCISFDRTFDPENPDYRIGWKTTSHPWNDSAVYQVSGEATWTEITGLDFAFVITPEPATMFLFCGVAVPVLLKRRRKA